MTNTQTYGAIITLAQKKIDALVVAYEGYSQFGVDEIIKAAQGYRRNGSALMPDSMMRENAILLAQEMLRKFHYINWGEDSDFIPPQFDDDFAKIMKAFEV
jgi:hypothetical protein